MAFNSYNRISSISAELCEAAYNQQKAENDYTIELNEALNFLDHVEIYSSYTNLLEVLMQFVDNDTSVLSEMIEDDFNTVMITQIGALNESTQKDKNITKASKIKSNIDKLSYAASDAIAQDAKKAVEKSNKVIDHDQDMYDKYLTVLRNYANLDGFTGIKNFAFPTHKASNGTDKIADVSYIQKQFKMFLGKVRAASDKMEIDKIAKDFEAKTFDNEAYNNALAIAEVDATEKAKVWTPSRNDVRVMVRFITNPDAVVNDISLKSNTYVKVIKSLKSAIDKMESTFKYTESELEVYKLNCIYKYTSETYRAICFRYNKYRSLIVKELSALRKAIMICGRYASKSDKDIHESVELQEMYQEVLSESCDLYIFDLFDN